MIKINYKEPENFETLDDISLSNIKICEKYKKIDYLELSCISWLKIDSKRNYQDLEKLFRNLNLDCYIIAQSIDKIPEGLRIGMPNEIYNSSEHQDTKNDIVNQNENKLKYIAKIDCSDKENSMKELLKYYSSYDENFKCLELSGCLMSIKKDNDDEEKNYQNIEINEIKKLLDCKLKLDLEYYKANESINYIIEDLTKKYGKEPEKIICGEIGSNKVWALMLNSQIVSPIGWIEKIIKQQDNENIIDYNLIDFRKIKIEKNQ